MSSLTFIRDPGEAWHFERLGIQPETRVPLHQNGDDQEEMPTPFKKGEQATVYHVQEVMRLTLSQLRDDIQAKPSGDNGEHIVTTNKIQHRFHELSYSADSIWSNWGSAVEKAGGTASGILQQLLGVRIREGGNWIPHFTAETVDCGEWHMIDDVRPTSEILEQYGEAGLWINSSTGLRLIRRENINQEDRTISLDHLLGANQRFPSAESWLSWCLRNGSYAELPQDQGARYFFRLPDDVDSFQTLPYAYEAPNGQWWTENIADTSIPHFEIHEGQFVFGILFKPPEQVDENDRFWDRTYAHFMNIETEEIILLDPIQLGFELQYSNFEGDLLDVRTGILTNLRKHIHNELLRALRIVVANQGLLNMPDINVSSLARLGLSGSIVETPFSEMYFVRPPSRSKPAGLVVGSPIERFVKSIIFKMNWYGL